MGYNYRFIFVAAAVDFFVQEVYMVICGCEIPSFTGGLNRKDGGNPSQASPCCMRRLR